MCCGLKLGRQAISIHAYTINHPPSSSFMKLASQRTIQHSSCGCLISLIIKDQRFLDGRILIRSQLIWMVLWELVLGQQMASPLVRFHALSFRSSEHSWEVVFYYISGGPWPLQLKISRKILRLIIMPINFFHFRGHHHSFCPKRFLCNLSCHLSVSQVNE